MSYMDGFQKQKHPMPKKRPGLMVAVGVPKDDEDDSDEDERDEDEVTSEGGGHPEPDGDEGMEGEGDEDGDEDGGVGGEPEADGMSEGERAAGNAAYHALRAGDKAGFGLALKQLVQACMSGYGDEDSADSEPSSGMMGS